MNKGAPAIIDALERQGITVDIAGTKPQMKEGLAAVRLRFDRVAMRFVSNVQSALHEVVPDGNTLLFTITAPIRLASKTATALEDRVCRSLAGRTARIDFAATIHGNQLRVRHLRSCVQGAPKVIGFVHNPETDPEILFDVTQSLFHSDGSKPSRRG
jgi:hypothetical protein